MEKRRNRHCWPSWQRKPCAQRPGEQGKGKLSSPTCWVNSQGTEVEPELWKLTEALLEDPGSFIPPAGPGKLFQMWGVRVTWGVIWGSKGGNPDQTDLRLNPTATAEVFNFSKSWFLHLKIGIILVPDHKVFTSCNWEETCERQYEGS